MAPYVRRTSLFHGARPCSCQLRRTRGRTRSSAVVADRNYATIVYSSYEDSLKGVTQLQDAIDAFLVSPSVSTQQVAKDAWLAAREPYGQTEAYRFFGGR